MQPSSPSQLGRPGNVLVHPAPQQQQQQQQLPRLRAGSRALSRRGEAGGPDADVEAFPSQLLSGIVASSILASVATNLRSAAGSRPRHSHARLSVRRRTSRWRRMLPATLLARRGRGCVVRLSFTDDGDRETVKMVAARFSVPEDEVRRFLELFHDVDKRGRGYIGREEFAELVERWLGMEMPADELADTWEELAPGVQGGPQVITFEQLYRWINQNYLPFQELTVESPVPEAWELATSALGVALTLTALGYLDVATEAGALGESYRLWAPPLGSVVVLLFGPGLQGRRGALGDPEAVQNVITASVGSIVCALLAVFIVGDPVLARAAAAAGALLWMRFARCLFAPAGAFSTLLVDKAVAEMPPHADLSWVAHTAADMLLPACVGSMVLFAAQTGAVWISGKLALKDLLSPHEAKMIGQLRNAFPSLKKTELAKFLREGEEVTYPVGAALTHQGERNDYLWLVLKGSLDVEVHGSPVAVLTRRAIVGEVTLLDPVDQMATATVRVGSDSDVKTLRWSQAKLRKLCDVEEGLGEKLLAALAAELIEKVVRGRGAGRQSPVGAKALSKLAAALPQVEAASLPVLMQAGQEITYKNGDTVMEQGNRVDYAWVLLFGKLAIERDFSRLATLPEGALVGNPEEPAQTLAAATVRVVESSPEGARLMRWPKAILRLFTSNDPNSRANIMSKLSVEAYNRSRQLEVTPMPTADTT